MVPLRFISESFGYNVEWDDKTKTVIITSKPEIFDDFMFTYTSRGTSLPYSQVYEINIWANGKYKRKVIINKHNKQISEIIEGELSEEDLTDFLNCLINENKFFDIPAYPADLTNGWSVFDADYAYMTVQYNGKKHMVGGYGAHVNTNFRKISEKMGKLRDK